MTVEQIIERLHARRNGSGWMAPCPAHEDSKPSLSVTERDGKILLHCHAGCTVESIVAAVDITVADLFVDNRRKKTEPRIVATYAYTDETGNLLYEVVRYQPKSFRQRRPDGNGGFTWNLNGARRVLYHLQDVIAAKSVIVVEGEKDVDGARAMGFTATCNSGGAGKWDAPYSEVLRGKYVTIISDADAPGRKHAQSVSQALAGIAAGVRVVELPGAKDLTEWVEHGGTKDMLAHVISTAWTSPEPKPEDGAAVLRDLETFIKKYVILPDRVALPLAIWIVLTYCFDLFDALAYLVISSPTPRCGKTRLLECLELVVSIPRRASNMSEAALFRTIEEKKPTLMMDEAETLSNKKSERAEYLNQILNAGNRPGAVVTRVVGQGTKFETQDFSVFCPKVFAGIGSFPSTLTDRAIMLLMQRRRSSEPVARFLYRTATPEGAALAVRACAIAGQRREEIGSAYQTADLDFLTDRDAEAWSPLFAILAVLVPERLQELRLCAEHLTGAKAARSEDESLSLKLLADVRAALTDAEPGIFGEVLLEKLRSDAESPWPTEVDLNARKLARLLRPFGLVSALVRIGGKVARGYRRDELEPVFSRYLSSGGSVSVTSVTPRENIGDSSLFPSVTDPPCNGSKKGPEPA